MSWGHGWDKADGREGTDSIQNFTAMRSSSLHSDLCYYGCTEYRRDGGPGDSGGAGEKGTRVTHRVRSCLPEPCGGASVLPLSRRGEHLDQAPPEAPSLSCTSHIHTWFLPFKLFFPCVSSKHVASKAQHSPLSRSDRTGRSSALSSPALDTISLLMLPWCPTALGHIKLQPVEALS